MAESVHDKLERVRKPHVHITYKVFTDDASPAKELPFVVGVMGDFSGNPLQPLEPLKKREFEEINRDSFNEIMAKLRPELNFRVENTLKADGSEMPVQLHFNKMDDFSPAGVAEQVPALKELLDIRERLKTVMAQSDRDPDLEDLLKGIIDNDKGQRDQLKKELGT